MIVCDDWEVMNTDVYACMCMSGDVQHFALCLTTTLWYLVMKAIVETLFSTGVYVYLTVCLAFVHIRLGQHQRVQLWVEGVGSATMSWRATSSILRLCRGYCLSGRSRERLY